MKMVDARSLKKDNTFYLSRDIPVSEIAGKSEKAVELLAMYGLHCTNCYFNATDTIENGARMHGMKDEEIDSMILEINEELAK